MGERPRYKTLLYDSARWEGFPLRDGDIIISTPPKCGTTWMQMLCALLIFQDPALPEPLTDLSPWLDVLTEPLDRVLATLEAQTHRRFIKSHAPLDALPRADGVTQLTVGRDLRDVALSWDNHWANLNMEVVIGARVEAVGMEGLEEILEQGGPPELPDDPVERFWLWIENDAEDAGFATMRSTVHHLQTFWDERDDADVALFHYADMQADLEAEMRRLAALLGIDVDEAKWPGLVAAATFDEMRSRADELAPQNTITGFWNDTNRFFNKGTSGQWRSFMDADDEARFEARLAALAEPALARWCQEGWSRSQRLP